jgi:hypothetical protein
MIEVECYCSCCSTFVHKVILSRHPQTSRSGLITRNVLAYTHSRIFSDYTGLRISVFSPVVFNRGNVKVATGVVIGIAVLMIDILTLYRILPMFFDHQPARLIPIGAGFDLRRTTLELFVFFFVVSCHC